MKFSAFNRTAKIISMTISTDSTFILITFIAFNYSYYY